MSADPIKAQSDIYITRSRTRAQLISKSPEIEMHGLRKVMYGILTPLGRIARLSQWQSMKFALSQTLVLVTVRDQGQGQGTDLRRPAFQGGFFEPCSKRRW